jgi:hypothetical protein
VRCIAVPVGRNRWRDLGGKRERELLEKRRGTSASLDWRRAGLADEAGGEATKPQGVVHRAGR